MTEEELEMIELGSEDRVRERCFKEIRRLWKERDEKVAAVQKFLSASGHDLCHENRAELAKAFGLPSNFPELPPECEFAERCELYRREIYGDKKI